MGNYKVYAGQIWAAEETFSFLADFVSKDPEYITITKDSEIVVVNTSVSDVCKVFAKIGNGPFTKYEKTDEFFMLTEKLREHCVLSLRGPNMPEHEDLVLKINKRFDLNTKNIRMFTTELQEWLSPAEIKDLIRFATIGLSFSIDDLGKTMVQFSVYGNPGEWTISRKMLIKLIKQGFMPKNL